jgi:uncharacterized protein YaaW (UPF0174 family)
MLPLIIPSRRVFGIVGAIISMVVTYLLFGYFTDKAKAVKYSSKSLDWKCQELRMLINESAIPFRLKQQFCAKITKDNVESLLDKIIALSSNFKTLNDEEVIDHLKRIFR